MRQQSDALGSTVFDEFRGSYDGALQRGLVLSGESKEYFADARLRWLHKYLGSFTAQVKDVLEFGCGTGYATASAARIWSAARVVGVDPSSGLLTDAASHWSSSRVAFRHTTELEAIPAFDMAFCNGVFHHIRLVDRASAVEYVRARLRPGGLFALWENNPWNPGTRLVMRRIPFDREAVLLSSTESRRLLAAGGFRILRTAYLFYFPRFLSALRPFERLLAGVPLGAQYCVLATKV